ncbi:MAG: 1-acyl-sn-glycerol-3-phosphate acyltransferase [Bacteroidales bacterium]|nr:1-acyl-sn-glycerol-3-phosphate acyltransferase [Bacteroidales bacterium]
MMEKIYDNTLYYKLLRFFVRIPFVRFFRQIEIRGIERIPQGDPVIFAGNHQNALFDALAILFFQKGPIVFMARADIFQNKIVAKFLRSLKIAPIYRIRDGFENLTKNEKQMNGAVNVLVDCKQMCLMPEGNLGNQHKLRPLVKGLFRIAYSAEERLNGEAHVKIVPVGIDFSYYFHSGPDLVVTYGEPIDVRDYVNIYRENQANGLNLLRDKLAASMSPLMHDIRSVSDYEKIYRLCCLGTPAYLDVLLEKGEETDATTMAGLRFDARCALSKILDGIDAENPEQIGALDDLCKRLKQLPGSPAEVSEWMDDRQPGFITALLMALSIPLLPGLLMNFPAWLISHQICKRIEDRQMHSTFVFTMGMLFNLIIYLVATCCLVNYTVVSALYGLLIFFFVTAYGLVSERARQALRLPLRRMAWSFGKRGALLQQCKADYRKLKEEIKKVVKNNEVVVSKVF